MEKIGLSTLLNKEKTSERSEVFLFLLVITKHYTFVLILLTT